VEKKLKTAASMATVAIPGTALEALKEWRKAQAAEQLRAKVWRDPDLVFATGLGTPLEPRNVNQGWYALCKRADVRQGEEDRIRIHDLRHATASFLFAEGADIKTIQSVLRHARHATTADIYTHVLAEVKHGAADTMDGVLSCLVNLAQGARRRRREHPERVATYAILDPRAIEGVPGQEVRALQDSNLRPSD
jgi:hypothetical protein